MREQGESRHPIITEDYGTALGSFKLLVFGKSLYYPEVIKVQRYLHIYRICNGGTNTPVSMKRLKSDSTVM